MKKLIIIVLMLVAADGLAQDTDSLRLRGEALIARQVEYLAELDEAGLDLSELTDGLEYFLEHPLNLNSAEKDELEKLVYLGDVQIKNLIDYRNKYGEFLSIYELKVIDGLGRNTLEKIMPFVIVAPVVEKAEVKDIVRGKHESIIRYQRKLARIAAYSGTEKVYAGDASRLYFRYRFRLPGKLSLGMIAEKDPGEKWYQKEYGPDFLSLHASYQGEGIIRKIIAGDYHARFGQGLVLWSGISFRGGSDPSSIKRNAAGISPNTSANENTYLRGVASALAYKGLRLSFLYSGSMTDANIEVVDSKQGPYITSFPNSGYHRTTNELADRNSAKVHRIGGNLAYAGRRFELEATACYSKYSEEIRPEPKPYNYFRFSGKENLVAGLAYDILLRRTNLFGEAAVSKNGGWALLAGITHTTDNGSLLCLMVRDFRASYQNLMAGAAGRRDGNTNERGAKVMMEFPIARSWTLGGSWEYYEYPWLTYGNDIPVNGQDMRISAHYGGYTSADISAYCRYRSNTSGSGYLHSWTDCRIRQDKYDLKLKARFRLSRAFSTGVQSVYTVVQKLEEGLRSAGAALMADMYYHPEHIPLKVTGRYAVFNTDDYASRVYAYENDVLYASSMPAYYGKGFRLYVLLKYTPVSWMDAWFRFSMTCYADRNTISSGHDEIRGNKLPEIKIQVRVKL